MHDPDQTRKRDAWHYGGLLSLPCTDTLPSLAVRYLPHLALAPPAMMHLAPKQFRAAVLARLHLLLGVFVSFANKHGLAPPHAQSNLTWLQLTLEGAVSESTFGSSAHSLHR